MAGTKLRSQAIDSSGIIGGQLIITNSEKNEVKEYLLGQLAEADQERLELRLLTDPAFGEEFDTIVDEITDGYVGNELKGEERERVQQYFLRSTERQNKMRFASELLERAAVERGKQPGTAVQPGIIERVRAFWANQTLFARFASGFAAIVIVAGLALLSSPVFRTSGTYVVVNLQMSSAERSVGSDFKVVRLETGTTGIRIELTLPEQTPPGKSYRVELIDEQQNSRNLPVEQQTDRMLVVTVPAGDLKEGTYVIHLYEVKPDGTEQRIRGSYSFTADLH